MLDIHVIQFMYTIGACYFQQVILMLWVEQALGFVNYQFKAFHLLGVYDQFVP